MAKATGARDEIPLCGLTIVKTVSFRPSSLISLEELSRAQLPWNGDINILQGQSPWKICLAQG